MIYLLPINDSWMSRRPHGPSKYMTFSSMEAEGEGWDPIKLAFHKFEVFKTVFLCVHVLRLFVCFLLPL